ncbi:MAG TPA: agmatinase [Methanobacterium sp.]|jgi:agmatinase|nr:MAG: agmatinase [Methanobacterium sp.]HOI72288.1 agmatinase [Methanobacterium sp.]
MLLYMEDPLRFAFSKEFNDEIPKSKQYGILGVPFDSTTTYLPGARFGSNAIREASYNLERYHLNLDKELSKELYDLGNMQVVHGNIQKTSHYLESTIQEVKDLEIIPITLGGEHGISYSVVKALGAQDVTVVHFDAHMDLRNAYQGEKYSHATVMRRIYDLNPEGIIQVGIRSGTKDESKFAQQAGVKYYTSSWVKENLTEMENVISSIKGPVYVTVDIDVLDPAYAPSVSTPCTGGLNPLELQRLIFSLQDKNVVGFDLMEVSSRCMGDITSINAAQVVYDFICL